MRDWPNQALSDLVEPDSPITYGVVKPGDDPADGALFIRGGDITEGRLNLNDLRRIGRDVSEQYHRTLLRGGELVVSLVGNPGQVAVVPETLAGANIARQVGLVRLARTVDTQFVKYFLLSPKGQNALGAHSLGSVQQVINLRDLKTVVVPVPRLADQRAIAAVLGALDDKIEQNRRTARALARLARAIFRAWFVDFEPVKAKAEGVSSFPSMPQEVFDALPTRFVDSEIGPVPEGWEVSRLGDLLKLHYGKSLTKANRRPGAVPVYGSGGIIGSHDEPLVEGAGIIVGRKGSVGTLYWEARGFFPIDTTFYVQTTATLGLHYVFELLESLGLDDMNTDAAVPGLNRENVCRLEVPVPPSELSTAFEHYSTATRDLISHFSTEWWRLAEMRDYLLPKLLGGSVRVRNVIHQHAVATL